MTSWINKVFVTSCVLATFLSPPSQSLAGELSPFESLQELVQTNSGSANPAGVNKIQDFIAKELLKMGFSIGFKEAPASVTPSGKLLVGFYTGSEPEVVSLIVHADTVFEKSSPFQKVTLSADKKKATGPGVIDDKGGIIVALEGLKIFLKQNPHPPFSIRLISSPSEETGTAGFLEDLRKFSKDSQVVLGFEPALEDGSIVDSRRGNRWYQIEVTGKEAHAGRAHAVGVNACLELSEKLAELSKLTNYDSDVTVSIGRMVGGQDKFNIVCGFAEAKVDTRFSSLEASDQLHHKIDKILKSPSVKSHATGEESQIKYEVIDDCPSFSVSKESKPFLTQYLKALNSVENTPHTSKPSGGSADSNYFSREGIAILDGLGPVGGKMHTSNEYIVISSLKTRAKALALFLSNLSF